MPSSEAQAQVRELLTRYKGLRSDTPLSAESLAQIIEERQKVIDQLSEIDETLAVVRQTIANEPDLQDLLGQIIASDRDLIQQATGLHDQIRASLSKTNKGRQATQGYRLNLPRSPAMIDKKV